MSKGPHVFKKSALAIGLISALGMSMPAQSASWSWGKADITFDSTWSISTGIRTEDRDFDNIGKNNQVNLDWTGYSFTGDAIYSGADIWRINEDLGSYSANGDNGNLAFDSGEPFSTVFSGLHELDVNFGDYGFFARGLYFYDFELLGEDRAWSNPLSNQLTPNNVTFDPCRDGRAEENACKDIRLLDAFVYADFYIGDSPISLRIGDQVISWGEGVFIQHGVNTINPVDVARARTPGAELKEVFIPVGTVFANIGINEAWGLSAYYQYQWEESILPVSGTYFSTNDFAGDGGYYNNIQLGFTSNPDIDLDFLLASLNGVGAAARAGADPTQLGAAVLAHSTRVAVREFGNEFIKNADDQGQYGVRLSYISEDLNGTEFSLYHINYHSKRPLLSGIASDFTAAAIGHDVGYLAANEVTPENITDLRTFAKAEATFPEDLDLWGFSFNTTVGETAIAGEVAYRPDEPLQVDDVTLLYAAFPEQLGNAGLRPDLVGISQWTAQFGPTAPGGRISGIVELDTIQFQGNVSHIFGPVLGTDNLIMLMEAGYVKINDMPDPSVLALEAPGTARSVPLVPLDNGGGNISTREGLHTGLSNGPEVDSQFATDDAWGYRILGVADFNDVFAGVNMRARATFSHDVDGTTPNPLFLFIEDRKSANLTFTFDYLSKFSASIGYSAFWDGGNANGLRDRDFVSFNFRYQI